MPLLLFSTANDGPCQATLLAQLTSLSVQRAAFGDTPSALVRNFEESAMHDTLWELHRELLKERRVGSDDRKEEKKDERREDKLRQVVKEMEDLLHISQPVALHWRDQGSAFMLVLQDFSVVHCSLEGGDVAGLQIDRSAADLGPDRLLSVAVDVMFQLMVASTSNGRLLLFDPRKLKAKFGAEGTRLSDARAACNVSLRSPASSVHINCSSDLVLVLCQDRLMLLHVSAPGKSGGKGARTLSVGWEDVVSALTGSRAGAEVVTGQFSRQLPHVVLLLLRLEPDYAAGAHRGHRFIATKYAYSRGERKLALELVSDVLECPAPVTAVDWNAGEGQLLLSTRDGSVLLHDMQRGPLRSFRLTGKGEFVKARWHSSCAVVLVAYGNGELLLLDSALHPLSLATDFVQPASSLPLSTLHGFQCHVALVEWATGAPSVDVVGVGGVGGAAASSLFECAAVIMDRGPAVVVRIAVGAATRGKLRAREMVAQHLASNDPSLALAVVQVTPDPLERYHCLLLLLQHILRTSSPASRDVLENVFEDGWAAMLAGMDVRQSEILNSSLRRSGHQLLRRGAYEQAYALATRANNRGLLEDTLAWALHRKEVRLARAVEGTLERMRASGAASSPVDQGPIKEDPVPPEYAAMLAAPSVDELAALRELQEELPALDGVLKRPVEEWESLSPEEVVSLGLYLETEGRIDEAVKLYELHRAEGALQRLKVLARLGSQDLTR